MNEVPKVKIERPLYDQQQLRNDYAYEKTKTNYARKVLNSCCSCQPVELLKNAIPVLEWLPKYKWKTEFSTDFVSGATVAIMHMSQGMAYAMLGNVPPVVGMYMAFFPVLIYFLLGESRHNSMGTFAVICLMTGKVVLEHSDPNLLKAENNEEITISEDAYTPMEVATVTTFGTAVIQLLMYVFRLGILNTLLSETLVSGFTTGAAVHVLVSQFKDLLGIKIPKQRGYFVNILIMKDIFQNIKTINYITVIISIIAILLLAGFNEIIKPRLAKKWSIPFPIELLVIVVSVGISYAIDLKGAYNVKIIGEVPSGLPEPVLPRLSLLNSIWIDCILIAIVSYTVTLSMGLIFAQRWNYEVDANQELLAMGAANIFGSFFSSMPVSASLSRSMIQESLGGKTQMVSLVSCSFLVVVLLWIGPYLETLPKCILAAVIVVALKGMLMQVREFFIFWSLSKLDALVWIVTFLTVSLIAIDVGLLVGIVMSLMTIFILGLKPYACLLGWVPHTDLYLDVKRYKGVKEIKNVKIFHYQGSINFASKNFFKSEVYKAVEILPQSELAIRRKIDKLNEKQQKSTDKANGEIKTKLEKLRNKTNNDLKCFVLDFSALSYIDPSGVTMLKLLSQEYQRLNIPIYIGGCSEPVYETMCKCDLLNEKKGYYKIFPTIHDAVQHASSIYSSCSDISEISVITNVSRL